jgi:hypothetical protein
MAWMRTRGASSDQKQPFRGIQKNPENRRYRHWQFAAALLAGTMSALGAAAPAHAGAVLLSRQSSLQAEGGGGSGGFDLTDATTNFDSYANDLSNANAGAPATSNAHQFSQPDTAGHSLQGAYAEGMVQASLNSSKATAVANSVFDMTFEVTQTPVQYTFGGAFGSAGSGTTVAKLTNLTSAGNTVFMTTTDSSHGASHEIDKQGFLPPGTYGLKVWANTPGTSASSSAYYTVNLTLSPVSNPAASGGRAAAQRKAGALGGPGPQAGGVAAAPLPPAVWTGLVMLGGVGVMTFRSRRGMSH